MVSSFINHLRSECNAIFIIHYGEFKLSMSLISWEKGVVLTILNIIHTLNFFAVKFVGPNIGKFIIDEVKAI